MMSSMPNTDERTRSESTGTEALAGSWPRFFARMLDLQLLFFIAMAAGVPMANRFPGIASAIMDTFWAIPAGMLLVLVLLLVDGLIAATAGNTPFKVLLGVRVQKADGERLNAGEHVSRSFGVWLRGMAMGIPFVNLVAMYRQGTRVSGGNPATYDESAGYRVLGRKVNMARVVAVVLVLIVLHVIVARWHGFQRTSDANEPVEQPVAAKTWSWQNPMTWRQMDVDAVWTAPEEMDTEDPAWMFTLDTDRVMFIVGVEDFPDMNLETYVEALIMSNDSNMRVPGRGIYNEFRGYPAWTADGTLATNTDHRLRVRVVQEKDRFWRTIAIQAPPHGDTDDYVTRHAERIWDTIIPVEQAPPVQ